MLGVFVMIAAVKIGILVFMGLDMLLPEPPVRNVAQVAAAPSVTLPVVLPGPATALAQQAPAAAPAAAPAKAAPVAATPDAQALLKRQDELDQREQALKALETDLNTRVAKLKEMETSIKQLLEEAKGVKDQKLKHLIDVYSNMNAKQAAKVLETLDNTIAVKILAGMRGRQAGDILNNMEAKKAAGLTEMLTKLQLPTTDNPAGPNG
ncbi:MotE family protein [Solidesulfovibrio alcoholivorans]|uniref:MotE family protein n=1 Tax=Solidesulfovibrio alcoholivorans TaxID=81406 RepID=UPI000AEE7656|nr:MotE family protein [Solidesulfovibrio alcoholivorans]